MKSRFEVLSAAEIKQIDAASMTVLAETGLKVELNKALQLFKEAGCQVDETEKKVLIPAKLVQWAVEQAPSTFTLYGNDPDFRLTIGGENVNFAGLGTPTAILDPESGAYRPTTLEDLVRHLKLINACQYINSTQMDVWPNDIPMTTIHAEAIWAWAHHSRKPFGMGCYGYLPTLDMMKMMAIAVGGKEELRLRPRFFSICSVVSPLKMSKEQLEGLLICADYGQPLAMSPEAIAGATAPATLAGLLVQENAAILAHITLAQIFRPGTPVLYGTVSTIANMKLGTVALGAVETGLISAASAQLARHYGLPIRSVGGATEAKGEDIQAGLERCSTLMQAALAGVNYITCAGTLDSTMLESEPLLLIDDEWCGAVARIREGITVNSDTLALDLIKEKGFSGHYLAEEHTVNHFKREHYIPSLLVREPHATWVSQGSNNLLERAKEKVREIIDHHRPRTVDPQIELKLDAYRQAVAARELEEFYLAEQEENQDYDNL
jgi:trimethylamine---corrinoid protein Co-methyltransferase